jgi:DNA recombination protein RmuC
MSNMLSFYSCLLLPYPLVIEAHFLLVFARKISLEEKLIAFSSQFNQLKEQLLNDKTILKSN